ncbi:hypothetical protein UFOVP103_17 [uncultured Caudovirales phage]|uniref:Uncharacterized protein n=1 Tax=uncultured Caudovirales phage TaxID=2100421 RepID=A0A6J7WLS9_9CAUD|nr:hypothetical protein UFOVP103_17 [uncultured Caudovirales phage]CAB5217014.1 hypothetical protein UFOVP197_38 [uncultured Caudovirales phage]
MNLDQQLELLKRLNGSTLSIKDKELIQKIILIPNLLDHFQCIE